MNIPLTPVTSSQIEAIGHDLETKTLAIQFKAKPPYPGSIYHYSNFNRDEFLKFSCAASIGQYFYAYIKNNPGKYPYQKIS